MGGHPLRPPTRRRLGAPLPHQLPDGPQPPPRASKPFPQTPLQRLSVSGISVRFRTLSRTPGQMSYVLRTRAPLESTRKCFPVRLACVRHAASVHPEPGSNSPYISYVSFSLQRLPTFEVWSLYLFLRGFVFTVVLLSCRDKHAHILCASFLCSIPVLPALSIPFS